MSLAFTFVLLASYFKSKVSDRLIHCRINLCHRNQVHNYKYLSYYKLINKTMLLDSMVYFISGRRDSIVLGRSVKYFNTKYNISGLCREVENKLSKFIELCNVWRQIHSTIQI